MIYAIYELEINSIWDDLEKIFEYDDDCIDTIRSRRKHFVERKRMWTASISGSSEEDAVKNWHNAEVCVGIHRDKTYELAPAGHKKRRVLFARNEYSIVGYGKKKHKQYLRTCLVWAKKI